MNAKELAGIWVFMVVWAGVMGGAWYLTGPRNIHAITDAGPDATVAEAATVAVEAAKFSAACCPQNVDAGEEAGVRDAFLRFVECECD